MITPGLLIVYDAYVGVPMLHFILYFVQLSLIFVTLHLFMYFRSLVSFIDVLEFSAGFFILGLSQNFCIINKHVRVIVIFCIVS